MTAINVLVMRGAVHVFSDGGHTDANGRVKYLGAKVFYLPNCNGVLAWTGRSRRGWEMAMAIDSDFALLDQGKLDDKPYSAIVARDGGAFVAAFQENRDPAVLKPAQMVRSMQSSIDFDPNDIIGSGVAMMHDQKRRHGLVNGFIQYSRLTSSGFETRILERL